MTIYNPITTLFFAVITGPLQGVCPEPNPLSQQSKLFSFFQNTLEKHRQIIVH